MFIKYVRDGRPVTLDEVKKTGGVSVVMQVFLNKDEVANGFKIPNKLRNVKNSSCKTEAYLCLNDKQYRLSEVPYQMKGSGYTYRRPYQNKIALITDKRLRKWMLDLQTEKTIFGVDSASVLKIWNENIFIVGLRWKVFDRDANVLDQTKSGVFQVISSSILDKREMLNGGLEVTRLTLKDLETKSLQMNAERAQNGSGKTGEKK